MRASSASPATAFFLVGLALLAPVAFGNPLDQQLGRAEVRVYSAAFSLLQPGPTYQDISLVERLHQLGYRRVRGRRPTSVGEYFWGDSRFWIFRRGYLSGGHWRPALLLELVLEDGSHRILSVRDGVGGSVRLRNAVLEPRLLSETLRAGRAERILVALEALPEVVWQAVLASEDARFFEHGGIDSRSVARALLANVRKGGVAQGGSTITQQLIKLRDLTAKRTMGRKLSEAMRALVLEVEFKKRDILESYLNTVYFGHVDGVEVYGIGAAAQAYFSKDATELNLAQAALLAGILQSPNRLSPIRNAERAMDRRRYVLARLADLGWVEQGRIDLVAKAGRLHLRVSRPKPMASASLLAAIAHDAGRVARSRLAQGRGVIVETHLDPWLQETAEKALGSAARKHSFQGAFVAGDARTGRIVAYIGSTALDNRDQLDRARRAHRQPGSTVKPLVVLEALENCGARKPLTLASLVADEPITIELASGPWSPRNADRRSRGVVSVRRALTESLNQATVRVAGYCGFENVATRFEELGLSGLLAEEPAFVLGAVEVSTRQLLEVYSHFAASRRPRRVRHLVSRVLSASGDVLLDTGNGRAAARHAPSPGLRFLMRDALGEAAAAAGIAVQGAWGKTGTSSSGRDAWFAGGLGHWVAVVWLGRDDGRGAGLSGGRHAAPVFQRWIEMAAPLARRGSREDDSKARRRLVQKEVDAKTGLVLGKPRAGSRLEWFRKGTVPSRRRWWKPGAAAAVIQ